MNKKLLSMATGVLAILGFGMTTASATPISIQNTENIAKVTTETPVFLELPSAHLTGEADALVAWHYSHQSHSSHSSHVSHQSHYSSRY
jgi:hypothetical protein